MEIEVNSENSYLGKDILQWCKTNQDDYVANAIYNNYFADEVQYKPNLNAYYFIWFDAGSMSLYSTKLQRDLHKSPKISR